MKNKRVFLIFFIIAGMLAVSIAPVSAQEEIDVDSMDNAQLTTLLLQIMQKLEQAEEVTETPEPTATPTPVPTITPQPELSDDKAELEALLMAVMQKLQEGQEPETAPEIPSGTMVPAGDPGDEPESSIWENKKLLIEALPEYMFIRKPVSGSEGSSESGDSFSSPEECYIYCANKDWGDNEGYAQCVKEKCGADKPPQIQSDWKR